MTPNLFPETLLVSLDRGQPVTDTLKVAHFFGKHHRDVLRAVRRAIERIQDPGRLRNFARSSYLNEQWRFIDAFNAAQIELAATEARYLAALDQIRPALRPVVEGTAAGHSRAAIAQPLGKSVGAISYHRRTARRLGLLPA